MDRVEYIESLSDRPDRCYADPWDRTRYFSVRNGLVRERECPPCQRNPVVCPNGKLHWDQEKQACGWADEANPRLIALADGERYLGE